ncbi:hypothetical protein DC31_00090 [Microbacterium sp. CH12i]|nr:hypothetical protein DC31_00090 [Microbacterium sp. CH12i]
MFPTQTTTRILHRMQYRGELDLTALSSNYELYQDCSNRVMEILSRFTPDLEQYSIDEAFF